MKDYFLHVVDGAIYLVCDDCDLELPFCSGVSLEALSITAELHDDFHLRDSLGLTNG